MAAGPLSSVWVVVVVFSVTVDSAVVVVAGSPVHGGVVGRSVDGR